MCLTQKCHHQMLFQAFCVSSIHLSSLKHNPININKTLHTLLHWNANYKTKQTWRLTELVACISFRFGELLGRTSYMLLFVISIKQLLMVWLTHHNIRGFGSSVPPPVFRPSLTMSKHNYLYIYYIVHCLKQLLFFFPDDEKSRTNTTKSPSVCLFCPGGGNHLSCLLHLQLSLLNCQRNEEPAKTRG